MRKKAVGGIINMNPQLTDFLKAGYPCVFLPTIEPSVAEERVKAALSSLGMERIKYGVWKITTGLRIGFCDSLPDEMIVQTQDLVDSLAFVETSEEPVVVVFHNLRQFVGNHAVIQQMQDTILTARLRGSHVILVGPHLELPMELRNLVTWCDCPLPDRDTILAEYKNVTSAYEEEIDLPSDAEEREHLLLDAANAAIGLDMMGAENALALSMSSTKTVNIRIIQAQKEQEVRKSDVLEFISAEETMDDVGGFGAFKDWMKRRRRVFSDEAREYGLPYPKGVLIVGPAGSGKSLVSKGIADFLKLPLLRLDMGKVFRSLVGESEAAIRQALKVVEAVSPVVLWLDEIDKGLAGMKGSGELDSGVTARVVATILTWRQETKYPVMLAATANDVTAIPAMVYRKGRLDEVWATDLPNLNERDEIFQIHLRKRGRDPKLFGCRMLASRTEDFVGAEIEGVIEDAMFSAFDEGKEVTGQHIVKAISETVPQARRNREEIAEIRKWVETRGRLVSEGEKKVRNRKVRKISMKERRHK